MTRLKFKEKQLGALRTGVSRLEFHLLVGRPRDEALCARQANAVSIRSNFRGSDWFMSPMPILLDFQSKLLLTGKPIKQRLREIYLLVLGTEASVCMMKSP